MAKNMIQFQYGMSLPTFLKAYGTEEQCIQALIDWRWSQGFECPYCGSNKYCQIAFRGLRQCNHCHHQTSVTAGTIFDSTKLPLNLWFMGMYLMAQDKKGISAMAIHRHLGISYNAAWRMKQKLMQVMLERESSKKLEGWIEVDDAYLGGEHRGGKVGRGAEGKTPFIAAVSTTEEGHPHHMKLSVVKGFFKEEVASWCERFIDKNSVVISDGLPCFNAFSDSGLIHDRIVCGGGPDSVEEPEFHWVNTMLGNLKNALRGTYHAVRPKYAQRYLSDFQYRFNRRFKLETIIPRLTYIALRTPPMPERLLKIGLA